MIDRSLDLIGSINYIDTERPDTLPNYHNYVYSNILSQTMCHFRVIYNYY